MTQNPATVCRVIASMLLQLDNLRRNSNVPDKINLMGDVKDRIKTTVKDFMPSGSGVDDGTKLDDRSNPDKLEFIASFHHMDENGCYDGWTDHRVIVKPSLVFGTSIRVTGRDRNQIKDYLHELFDIALGQMVVWDTEQERYVQWADPNLFVSTKIEMIDDPGAEPQEIVQPA